MSTDVSHLLDMSSLGVLQNKPVISGQGATVTLNAAQSGSTCLFDSAAGIVYTLPAPVPGIYFDFFVTVTITSNSAKVITSASTIYMIGVMASNNGGTAAGWPSLVATTNIAVKMNGTTTGGIEGTTFRCQCLTSGLWSVEGTMIASGTTATPFSTS